MPSPSKAKGNRGEAALAKLLGDILGGHFSRVPNSGAMVGGINASRKASLSRTQNRIYRGDLIPPDHLPRMVIESKSYAAFPWHQLVGPGGCRLLDGWIGQTLACIEPEDAWFVAFRVDRLGLYVVVPESGQGYEFGSHAFYAGSHGAVRVTGLAEFYAANQALVLHHCG